MSENGPRRLLAAALIRAAQDALGADSNLATKARGWLRTVGGDLLILLDIPSKCLAAWPGTLPPLPVERLDPFEAQQVR